MKNITFKIYLLIDSHGEKTAVVTEDSSETVQVCGMKNPSGELLYFEAEAYHIETFCADNGIELRVVNNSIDFATTWDTVVCYAPEDRVLYVPSHANGDTSHPDCHIGFVSSVRGVPGEQTVYVRYTSGSTGELTPIKFLRKW